MIVLGVHIGHDSSAALVVDGRLVADVAEERFVRVKHYCGLPIKAVEYCLQAGGIDISQVDVIAVPSSAPMPDLNVLFGLEGARREKPGLLGRAGRAARSLLGRPDSAPPLYLKTFPCGPKTEIAHVEHHLAHAASAYYTSGNTEKQLVVTIDGAGDGVSIGIWIGEGGRLRLEESIPTNGSIGWFYSNVTEALGWWHGDGEGKTMGLAPYGDADACAGVLDEFAPRFASGKLDRPRDFGRASMWNENGALQWHFPDAGAISQLVARYGRENIAAEAQRVLEREVKELVLPWLARERTRNLSAAGGVMLNVKLNQRLWETGQITNHHTYPNPGDSGLAVGAALHAAHAATSLPIGGPIQHLYWGPEFSNERIEADLKLRRVGYQRVEDASEYAARRLAEGAILGWFQGRMESGPRALGARSILMSANRPENKDVINARVKFREAFRPFCPSLLDERRDDYLVNGRREAFMITSFTCTDAKRSRVPAVVHADNTLRPQTVVRSVNERYWRLIHAFGERTGENLVLNTSFNVMGEPIVNSPSEAIRCFFDSGIDALVIGDFVVEKSGLA